MWNRLRNWARLVKRDAVALWLAARDPRTPTIAKVIAAAVAAYALSPIDLIPDFIPVLGYLDEVIILPIGIVLAVRLIPTRLIEEFRQTAAQRLEQPTSIVGLIVIVAAWLLTAALLLWWLWPSSVSELRKEPSKLREGPSQIAAPRHFEVAKPVRRS